MTCRLPLQAMARATARHARFPDDPLQLGSRKIAASRKPEMAA